SRCRAECRALRRSARRVGCRPRAEGHRRRDRGRRGSHRRPGIDAGHGPRCRAARRHRHRPHVPRCERLLGARRPGRDHPRRNPLGARRITRGQSARMTGTRRAELVLAGVLVAESAIFALTAPNFATFANAAEIVRLGVEVGLLALALTPIVVTGGIDLSCGALLGLSAVVFGALWRDAGWSPWTASLGALAIGASGGALNGWLIARWSLPPLMVTLGALSLFRGLAEGLTGGIENYTGLPPRFLALGQGFLGAVPAQAPWLLLAALAYWVVVHRTTRGRAYFAIGHNPAASRHAGLAVTRRLFELYVASGALAGLAAIIYVAHLG